MVDILEKLDKWETVYTEDEAGELLRAAADEIKQLRTAVALFKGLVEESPA